MESADNPLLLTKLKVAEVRERLATDRRLIVPLGACDQYGPHLPIGAATRVAERFAHRLSSECGVLCAPTLAYGVNLPTDLGFAGAATLREKTLHASLNDLLTSWEDDGFEEFILITVHAFDTHVEAAATVNTASARVRVVEVLNLDLTGLIEGEAGADHGGEILTSLMLHLEPELVDLERAGDFVPPDRSASTLRRLPRIPAEGLGSVGRPTIATAEKGRRLYEHILERIRERVFESGPDGA